jgi:hypothetical protein
MDGNPAGIRLDSGGAIESGFELRHERDQRGLIRAGRTWRGHFTAPNLMDDFLPNLGIPGHVVQICLVQHDSARAEPFVVACRAILVNERP